MGTKETCAIAQLQRTRSRPLPRDADLRCVHGRLAQDGEPHTQRQLLLQARQQELLQGQRRQAVRQSDAVRYTTEEKAERMVGVFLLETHPATWRRDPRTSPNPASVSSRSYCSRHPPANGR